MEILVGNKRKCYNQTMCWKVLCQLFLSLFWNICFTKAHAICILCYKRFRKTRLPLKSHYTPLKNCHLLTPLQLSSIADSSPVPPYISKVTARKQDPSLTVSVSSERLFLKGRRESDNEHENGFRRSYQNCVKILSECLLPMTFPLVRHYVRSWVFCLPV